MGTSRLKSRGLAAISPIFVNHKNNKQGAESMLEAEIARRRTQACRSLLIQVQSSKTHNDLHAYCSRFGNILSMHHYRINNQHNYILVEFENIASINKVMSYASFINWDNIAPVKSSVLWFSKGQGVSSQKNSKQTSLFVENGCTLLTEQEITKLLYNTKSISGQIILLYDTLKLTDLEIRLRFHTAYHLEQYFSRLFENLRVLPFGSSINGFGKKRCDLDLVLVPDNEKHHNKSRLVFHSKCLKHSDRNETKEFLGVLANTMYHFIPGVFNVRKILEARVPIIKFRYDYTHTECDLSATNMTAIYMTELLNLYGEIDWRVRPLVIAIRVWAKSQEITSDFPGPWITNFALTLLVLFYLQQKKILPSLRMLKSYATEADVRYAENGTNCTFLRNIAKLPAEYKYNPNQDTLETLLHGFFEYYASFDFHTYGICIREGTEIRKPERSALHITNPLETTLNVSKNVNLVELNHIIVKSHDALYTLETAASKSRSDVWGIMALLKVNSVNTNPSNVNPKKSSGAKQQTVEKYLESMPTSGKSNNAEEQIAEKYSESVPNAESDSYEIPDKFEVSEANIDETKTQKKEIV